MDPSTLKLPQLLSHEPDRKIIENFRVWESNEKKIATIRNHLHFTLHCKHHDVTPPSLKLKCAMKGHNADLILKRAQKALTNERINDIKRRLATFEDARSSAEEYLFTQLPSDTYYETKVWMASVKDKTFNYVRVRQKEKFRRLINKTQIEKERTNGPITDITEDEIELVQSKWLVNL